MTPEILRRFIAEYPELCSTCWFCSGKGIILAIGVGRSNQYVDCYECYRLGKLPDIIKIVEYLLKDE